MELKPGDTFTHDGAAYTVVRVHGANVFCTNADGKTCLIPLKDAKGS